MKRIIICALLASAHQFANAQFLRGTEANQLNEKAESVLFSQVTNAPAFIGFKNGEVNLQNALYELRALLAMGIDDSWKPVRNNPDQTGMIHYRWQQFYKNVKVETGEYILHEKNGYVISANGCFFDRLNLNVQPAVSEAAALQAALKEINAAVYKWQVAEEEQFIKTETGDKTASYFPVGELVITPLYSASGKPDLRLAFKFDIYAHEPMSRHFVYVDARSGNVIRKENRICEIAIPGTAVTKYNGPQSIVGDSIAAASYRLRDYTRGNGVETWDMNNGTSYGSAVDFTDTNNYWDSLSTNGDGAAYSAHWGAEMTYDYYLLKHNRNSYNNAGAVLKSYVHYSSNYNNAFWNGSVMTYGDGNGTTFSPLTSLDVCGHELTHGVTQFASGLVYSYQSGALNESFSDIFGTAVEFFADTLGADWIIGEDCYTPATPGDGIRYMNNPNLAGDPDTYLGTNWYSGSGDNGGVHTNSGVQNFWFYLLCVGGIGTNDFGFNYNVAAIGMTKAAAIAYRTNEVYLTSGSQYADARNYSLQAAADLYGPCSPEQYAVKNAWDAVGVSGAFNPLPNVTASSNSPVCPGNGLQLLSSSQTGISYSWTGPGGYTSTLQNPYINAATSMNAGTYIVVVTDNNGCSGQKSTEVVVNEAPTVNAGADMILCEDETVQLNATATAGGNGGPAVSSSNTTPFVIPDANQTGIQSPITVNLPGLAKDVISVTIDSLTHTWDGDLFFYLIAPNNSQINLALGVGGSGDNFFNTVLSSAAVNVIGTTGNNTAPFSGTYAPQQSFSNLTGNAAGTWKLKVVDAYSQDLGTLWKWTLTLSGPNTIVSYSWNPATGLSSTSVPDPLANPPSSQTYTVEVTDSKGCSAKDTISLIINPMQVSGNASNLLCNGDLSGSVDLSVSGGNPALTFLWSNGATTEDISGLSAGTYSVVVTDAEGCSKTSSFIIAQPDSLLPSCSVTSAIVCYGETGNAEVSVTGGTMAYAYQWSNGETSSAIAGAASGNYSVIVTDANGCTASCSVNMPAPAELVANCSSTNSSCSGTNNGSATVLSSGGTGSHSYLWSTGSTAQSLNNLSPGTYTVIVTDDNGCTKECSVTINEPSPLSTLPSINNVSCFGLADGSVLITVSGGTAPYSYQWSNGATGSSIDNLTSGIYALTVTDANGCSVLENVFVNEPQDISVSKTKQNVSCNGGNDGSINLNISGGTSPYGFQWNNGATTEDISSLAKGTYIVILTDANGCTKSNSTTISQPSKINVTKTKTNVSCWGGSNGSIDITVSGGTPPYSYSWTTGATTQDLVNIPKGTYIVIITDAKGCTKSNSTTVSQPAKLNITATATSESAPGANDGTATANPTGGVAPYAYAWNTSPVQTSQTATGLAAGSYQVVVTDANGCTKSKTIAVPSGSFVISNPVLQNAQVISENEFMLYPNPCSGEFTVSIMSKENVKAQFRITGVLGNELLNSELELKQGCNSIKFSGADLSPGFYFMKASYGDTSKVVRFVKE